MKDAGFALSVAYAALLSGLTYQDQPVRVYDLIAPDFAVAPYVIVQAWQGKSDNTKSSFGQSGEINLDVVTRFTGDARSKKPAALIADQITELLKPTPTAEPLQVPGFSCWNTRIIAVADGPENTNTAFIIRKIITVSHSLCQL